MVSQVGALLCPHPQSRWPEGTQASSAPTGLQRTTVYVDGGKGTMGLCLACLAVMKALVSRRAGLSEVLAELTRLGYTRADAARFHADMARGPLRWCRRLMNPLAVRLLPEPALEASA